jgi:aspartate carbamoyltransferase catalytic subunit
MGREMEERLSRKDLLGLEGVSKAELDVLLETASSFREVLDRPIKKVPTLRGKTVLHLFFEPSTRTQASFDLAAKRLSADTVSLAIARSSVTKGESILDTLKNLEAMKIDAVVIRHSSPGVPHFLSAHTDAAIINAGDGAHEHPTQALLDMLTMVQRFGTLEGLKVLIVGDILHSRVARSNIFGLLTMGAEVNLSGPPTLVPRELEDLGARLRFDLDDAVREADVIMALRVQRERLESSFFPTLREYRNFFGITRNRVKMARKDAILMHPGPVNWGVELDPDVKDSMSSLILDQVTNGVAVRMAVLYHLVRGETGYEDAS